MKYLKFCLIFLLFSCNNEFYYKDCNSSVSDYTGFKYEFINKKLIKIISKDSVFDADIIITKTSNDTISYDSIFCYCLAICDKKSLGKSRFYWSKRAYDVVKKFDITDFSDRKGINTYEGGQALFEVIAFVTVEKLNKDWKKQLTSDNIKTPKIWYIPPPRGKGLEKKLKLK